MKFANAALLAATLLILSLYECGNKGPLYLPDAPDDRTENEEQTS